MSVSKKPLRANSARSVFAVAKRHSDPAHTDMLLDAQRLLPEIAHAELQNRDLLNGAIEKQKKAIDQRVDAELHKREVEATEVPIWRSISSVRFGKPTLRTPHVSLGRTISSLKNERGDWRPVGSPLIVCDFLLSVEVVYVAHMYLSLPDVRTQLKRSSDAFDIEEKKRRLGLFGNVYPAGTPLGEVALHLAEVSQALSIVRSEQEWDSDERYFPFFMTDDPVLYDALSPQYDGCLDVEGVIEQCDLGLAFTDGIGEPSFNC